jgi:hypothetical protein
LALVARPDRDQSAAGANASASENFLTQAGVTKGNIEGHFQCDDCSGCRFAGSASQGRDGILYFVSCVFSPAEFVREDLCELQDIVVASAHHRLAKRKQVSIEDLAGERWASIGRTSRPQWRPLIDAFQKHGLPPPRLSLSTNSQVPRASAIAYSDYLGVVTSSSCDRKRVDFR